MIAKLILLGALAAVNAVGPDGYGVGIKYAQPAYGAKLAYAPAVQVQSYAPAAYKVAAPLQAAVKVAEPAYPPQPYEYGYEISDEHGHGSFNQHETGDEHGNKKGSYTIKGNDGLYRTVEYVADENGFRAHISTNEPGTAPISPADVLIDSKPVTGEAAPQVVKAVASAPAILKTPVYGHQQIYAQQQYAAPAVLKAPVYASQQIYAQAPAVLKAPVYAQQQYAAPAVLKAPVYAAQQVYAQAPAVLKAPVYASQRVYAQAPAVLKAPVYAQQQYAAPAVLKAPVYAAQQVYAQGPAVLKAPVAQFSQHYAAAPALLKTPALAQAPIYANAGPLYAKAQLSHGHY